MSGAGGAHGGGTAAHGDAPVRGGASVRGGAPVRGGTPMRGGTPVRDALQGAITAFTAAGCETPRLDAEVLLAHVLGVTRERLIVEPDLEVSGAAVPAYRDAVRRRSVLREPVAYITGLRAFRRIELRVDHRVLIPRPETELLVEVGLDLPKGACVLDLCTGSGAVALALKDERPDLEVWGSDLSADALAVARANGERLGLEVGWLQADLLEGVPDRFDALLANPPYVGLAELRRLQPEVQRHEPRLALAAGEDGLATIRQLLAQAASSARSRIFAIEVGAGQADTVAAMMRDAGLDPASTVRDLAGIERVVKGRRRASTMTRWVRVVRGRR